MDIIQINASYKPAYIYGGPTVSVSKLTEELFKSGKNVEVLTTTANGEKELNVDAGIKTRIDGVLVTFFSRITKDPSHFSPALLVSLWKTLQDENLKKKATNISTNYHFPKLVHIHAWWNFVSVGSCAVALLANCPVVLSPRGNLSNYSFSNRKSRLKNLFHSIIGKALLKRCHFHVTSEKEKQDILNIVKPRSLTVIPNFVTHKPKQVQNLSFNFSNLKSNLGSENHQCQPFRLLFLSRIEEKKGLEILLKGLESIVIPWHLTIAGSGDPNYISFLKLLSADLNINLKISWIGQQDYSQKFRVLASHDLLVLPSYDENFANVVLESLSEGTPVLISKNVGLADYVYQKDLGWIADNSPAAFSRLLEIAFHEKEKRDHIRTAAPRQIASDFNDQNILNQYLQMYNKICLCPNTSI